MKRLLWFVVLLAAGSLALWFAVGGDQARANGVDAAPSPQTPTRDDADRGRPVHRQPDGTELQIRGGFVIAPYRTVPAADGNGVDRQPIYELECRDCVPTDDGRHRLDDVRVKLFDRGEHAADLHADHAVVELEVSADNKKSLRENRELELSAAVLETAPGRSTSIRLEVGRVRALVDEDLIRLHTPDDDEPVTVTTGGAREGTLRGRGLRARMPRSGVGGGGRFDLQILREPSIELAGIELRAGGALNYVEQLATGAALVTVERDVRVELADPKRTGSLSVRGDRLHGWLQRGRRGDDGDGAGGQQALVWTMLRLLGSRAQVRTDDIELDSPRLTVLPGPTGLLARITADGGSSDLRQRAGGASFRSSRPIHLVRTRDAIGALHRAFGFPSYALGPLAEFEVVTFEGASSVDAGDGVQLASDRGLHLFRQPSAAAAGHFVARGFGDVRIARGEGDELVEATGDSGFVLWRTSRGDDVVLGRDDPASPQRYTLRRGPLQLRGAGAARLLRTADDRVQVSLRSAAAAITGAFGRRGDDMVGTLRAAETLDVVVADKELESFVATGADTEVEFVDRDRRLLANGRRIEQRAAGSWRLSGDDATPARLRQPPLPDGRTAQLWAPTIDVHRAAARDVVIEALASGDRSARVEALLSTTDGAADAPPAPADAALGRLDARAERIRLLPFAVGPATVRRHLIGLSAPLADIAAGGLGRPWLLATGDVVADFVDRPGGALHGEGALLATSQGARSLLLVGDGATGAPALMHRTEDGVRTLAAAGPRVRFTRGTEDRIVILTSFPGRNQLVPPRVTFRTATDPDDPLAWMRGECRGEIEVAPDGVLFHGPVTAHSLLPSGVDDPNGMHIEAEQLRMVRQRESGELTRVDAGGGVAVRWRHLWARSERVELDLRWQRCIAEDPNDAVLGLGDGRVYRARRLEANYATYAVRSYDGRFVQEAAQVERR
ncbi:MAG: hypothetical protein AB7O97_11650 [Planctomycetota bacterium]